MANSHWESKNFGEESEIAENIAVRALQMPEFQALKGESDKIMAIKKARELLEKYSDVFPEIQEAKRKLRESDELGQPGYDQPLDFVTARKIINSLFPRK